MNPPLFHHPEPFKKPKAVVDPEYEAVITRYVDAVLEEEKGGFQPGIESFQVHANRFREEIHTSMVQFQQKLKKGYETIGQWLDANKMAKPVIQQNKKNHQKKLPEDKYLYQLFGLSEENLKTFYKAAYNLAQAKEFTKAKDAAFFLATIAPHVADFWLALSISATKLAEYDTALDATLHLLTLNPKMLSNYLNGAHLYLKLNEPTKAKALCQQGIDFAQNQSQEPWAKEFIMALEEAILQIRS